eukprot:TRINITY_DN79_c0_g1_i3.p1 TRINITY_DN79_c0_g1~~TRINITY_DN79_c0_g1_i3.p1  ORF type:complete len:219 (-),score=16.05 TRINITY_DN79_c0_g1_i3:98-754(-)
MTRNLGTFIVYLTLTRPHLGWDDISISFIQEAFSRSVRWYLRDYPRMETLPTELYSEKRERLDVTFKATKTSRMLLMFQVYFLNNTGRRAGEHPKSLLKAYNKSLGRPSRNQKEHLQSAAKKIMQCGSWNSYFHWINVEPPSQNRLVDLLVNAVRDSKEKGYHFKKRSQQFRNGRYNSFNGNWQRNSNSWSNNYYGARYNSHYYHPSNAPTHTYAGSY